MEKHYCHVNTEESTSWWETEEEANGAIKKLQAWRREKRAEATPLKAYKCKSCGKWCLQSA